MFFQLFRYFTNYESFSFETILVDLIKAFLQRPFTTDKFVSKKLYDNIAL